MGVTIHPIILGVDYCYLIRGEKKYRLTEKCRAVVVSLERLMRSE